MREIDESIAGSAPRSTAHPETDGGGRADRAAGAADARRRRSARAGAARWCTPWRPTTTGRLRHYKVQDPSLRNWHGLALAVRGERHLRLPHLQQELRPLLLRQRSLTGWTLHAEGDQGPDLAGTPVRPRPARRHPQGLPRPAGAARRTLPGGLPRLPRRLPDGGHHAGAAAARPGALRLLRRVRAACPQARIEFTPEHRMASDSLEGLVVREGRARLPGGGRVESHRRPSSAARSSSARSRPAAATAASSSSTPSATSTSTWDATASSSWPRRATPTGWS